MQVASGRLRGGEPQRRVPRVMRPPSIASCGPVEWYLVGIVGVQEAHVDDLWPLDEHEAEDLARLHPEAEPRARRDAVRRDRREAAAARVKPVVEHRVERVARPRQGRCGPSAHGPPGDAASG